MRFTLELATERCVIRGFRESDIDAFMRYRNDADWMRYQGFKCKSREEYERALLGEAKPEDGVQLAVAEKTSGRLIGDLYLKKEENAYWVGYTISPHYARRGYAFEALGALAEWIARQGAACVKAGVLPENEASVGLLRKLGFQSAGMDEAGEEEIYVLPLA
ncbi:MAG TPA: GNAT family N-acetyltransferase [Clostridia bacterium]|mgnify:CR=1 FL=1|jgi:ribosomal-protein-alanine N-acetyltransferase|nr:MAG: ribosomal-protein-S5-alanine N-acetyltransferase [Firmicutes bacterium ADurb.Bin248]HOS18360.1 GNAT family N-acetyltransferase [Clostridia bacterium]HPK15214.1 GNAT family N-acetyltransferase [Clostridia bacterium]